MSWIAISDGRRALRQPDPSSDLVPVGSLVIETRFLAIEGRRQDVVDLNREAEWKRRFRLSIGADGDVVLWHRQGPAECTGAVRITTPDRDAVLRISYVWHAPDRLGVLAVENLDTGSLDITVCDAPQPWPVDDIAALVADADACRIEDNVTLLACADAMMPVGIDTGLAAGTPVDTPRGPVPVEELAPGDLVITAERGLQAVRHVVRQSVPALGRYAPVDLCAPFFGLRRDVRLAPDHRLAIGGADAEYLFGTDTVLVEARHLERMAPRAPRKAPLTVDYVQLLLDRHVSLSVAGSWCESLFVGDLADDPVRLAISALSDIPADQLPRHTRIAGPQLRGFEAMVLVSALCA